MKYIGKIFINSYSVLLLQKIIKQAFLPFVRETLMVLFGSVIEALTL